MRTFSGVIACYDQSLMGREGGRWQRGVPINPAALRKARLDAGLTQAQVADGIMTKQALHLCETGRNRPTRVNLLAIIERLGITLEAVLVDPRDPREREMADLAQRQQHCELEKLASRVLNDRNVTARTHGVARYYLGRAVLRAEPERACRELRQARRQLAKLGESSLAAEAMEWEAAALYMMQDPGAVELGRKALAQYRQLADRVPAIESRMLEHIGTFLLQRSEFSEAIASYHQAVEVAGSLLDLARLANIYHGLSLGCRLAGQTRLALDYMERAISFYRSEHDVRGSVTDNLARAENDYGLELMKNGRLEQAEEMIRAALDHFQEAGVEAGRAHTLLSMAELRQLQGNLDEAMEWTSQAIELAERLDEQVAVASGYQQLGEIWAQQGEGERFEAAFTRAIEILDAANLGERRKDALMRYYRARESAAASAQA
jgi:tetratricopeptide (TPR) repeat protein